MNGGTVAAHELFTALEKAGLVNQSTFVKDNQVRKCSTEWNATSLWKLKTPLEGPTVPFNKV